MDCVNIVSLNIRGLMILLNAMLYTVGLKKKSVIFVIFRLTVLNQMMSSSEKVGAVTYTIAFLILLIVEVLL